MDDAFWLESIRDLLVIAIGTLIGIVGAIYIFKREENSSDKKSHFLRIKEEVLSPWLDKLTLDEEDEKRPFSFPTERDFRIENKYNSINEQLLEDVLKSHFQNLKPIKKALEKNKETLEKQIVKIANKLNLEYDKREFDKVTLRKFFILGQDSFPNLNFHIDYSYLMYGIRVVCSSDETESKKIKERLESLYQSNECREIKKIHSKMEATRKTLVKEIKRALASESLHGKCEFIT